VPVAAPLGYDPNSPTPFFGVLVRLGVGGKAVTAPRKIMVLGNFLAAALTRSAITGSGGSVAFNNVLAGTAIVETPVAVVSPEDADTQFGQGSECALMCRAIFAQYKSPDITVCPVAEGGSAVKATATLTFVGAPGTAGVARLIISGQQLAEVPLAAAQTIANMAGDVAIAINQNNNLPCTASASLGVVTLTAKQGGPRGNDLGISCEITTTTTTVALNGGTASTTLVRGRFGTGTATAGSVADSITNALAAVATGSWFYACALTDATNMALLKTHLATYDAIGERKRQQAVMALKSLSLANAIAFNTGGSAANATRVQICYQRDSGSGVVDPWTPSTGEIAASMCAARLYGDGAVGNGGTVRGEISYPAQNLDGVLLGGVKSQRLTSCGFLQTEITQLLNAGITPVGASTANPGFSQAIKSITSYWFDTNGSLTRAVHDTTAVTVADHAASRIENAIRASYPNKNVAPDPTNFIAPPTADVVYPSMVRGTVVYELRKMEAEGLLVNVDANLAGVVVEQHATNKSLLLAQIPVQVIPNFHAFAGELQQLA